MKKKLILSTFIATAVVAGMISYLKKEPTISAVIIADNNETILSQSIDSILNQTYKKFELIIVDNGLQKSPSRLVKTYAKNDDRIKVIQIPKDKDVNYAKNKAIKQARGKYISIINAGDVSLPYRFEKSLKVFEENPETVAISGTTAKNEDKLNKDMVLNWNKYNLIENNFSLSLIFGNTFPDPASMFKKDFVLENNITYKSTYKGAFHC